MSIIRYITFIAIIGLVSACKNKVDDSDAHVKGVVSILSLVLKAKASSTTSSYSTNHAEFSQTSVIDLQLDTEADAVKISNLLKKSLEKSDCKILVFNSFATVKSESNGQWSGAVERYKDSDFVGDSYGVNFEEASGEMLSVEKLYISCVISYEESTILIHCKLFPEEHRAHLTASTIQ